MKPAALLKTATEYPQVTAIQRLGYILDVELNHKKLADVLQKALRGKNVYPVALSNNQSKVGELNESWKLINNTKIEADI